MSKETQRVTPDLAQTATIINALNEDDEKWLASKERALLVERWKNAPERPKGYPAGDAVDRFGNPYTYNEGVRLWIGDEKEVMDSCQDPWAKDTVEKAFFYLDEGQTEKGPKQNVNVLERGFGIGLIAKYVMEELRKRGGSYTVIELNDQVNKFIKNKWITRQNTISRAQTTSQMGAKFRESNVTIQAIEGDAVAETKRLAEAGRKFHIIISDTFPLHPKERRKNDLLDMENLVRCLDPKGVFAFFGYFAGYQGELDPSQRSEIVKYFREYHVTPVTVNPPPDYNYFKAEDGMIREIPVVVCLKPRYNLIEGKA